MKFKENNNNQPTRGPHPDYERNLKQAEQFCINVQKSLYDGMKVCILDNNELKRCLLMISWKAPQTAPIGNYANPIFLHQSKTDYDREVERVFNSHMKRAQKWHKWQPAEPLEAVNQ